MGRFIPKLNENIYKAAEKANGRADMKNIFHGRLQILPKNKLQRYIDRQSRDVIVCSIVMTAMLITALKEAGTYDESIVKSIKDRHGLRSASVHRIYGNGLFLSRRMS